MDISFGAYLGTFSVGELILVTAAVAVGGILRGAAGFGFSLLTIVTLTAFMPPAQVVPFILLWEILASVGHLPFVFRQVDWNALKWLTVGVLIGTPFGVWVVIVVPPEPMVLGINTVVLALTGLMFFGIKPKRAPTVLESTGVGILSGVVNGACANGGPPVILMFLASPAGAAVGRASLIAFFLITDAWASIFYWHEGLLGLNTVLFSVMFLPALGVGLWIGSLIFARMTDARFKRASLIMLMGIALAGIVRTLFV